ncbi:predicted protein [Thalassiosira pseudonana CCMP1335]|uniref:Uncharacterized protein n=1 Tax=Thalassiosira pseudonana TaxID=35128 RepID=B8BWY3_THAPS|nr:predicted protein [Thalassiosira pseudonana CCMP1335]EED93614.1 predicted protein [Thalassiosira pseudonana CCMP1335]|eukprot:scaffold1795_cov187-Alexandrium_tamarense.AAC.32
MKLPLTATVLPLLLLATTDALSLQSAEMTRRRWLYESASSLFIPTTVCALLTSSSSPRLAFAEDDTQQSYDNPNIPVAPEERSGLVVLRVAEVAQFQEKILRAILNGDIKDVIVTPQQIVFGTQILLRNSNLAGNMKLMVDTEIPRSRQKEAAIRAANTMNTLQKISSTAAKIEREMSPSEYEDIANLYRLVRVELNGLYELLPEKEKAKYYGYFVDVTEYEKKVAEGVYNPDLDGVLKFDYDD